MCQPAHLDACTACSYRRTAADTRGGAGSHPLLVAPVSCSLAIMGTAASWHSSKLARLYGASITCAAFHLLFLMFYTFGRRGIDHGPQQRAGGAGGSGGYCVLDHIFRKQVTAGSVILDGELVIWNTKR